MFGLCALARACLHPKARRTAKELADSEFAKWRSESAKKREDLGVSVDFAPWGPSSTLKGLPPKARYRDVIDVAWIPRTKTFPDHTPRSDIANNFCVDPTQGLGRQPWAETVR